MAPKTQKPLRQTIPVAHFRGANGIDRRDSRRLSTRVARVAADVFDRHLLDRLTPVWLETDGEHLYLSPVPGHLKERNVHGNPAEEELATMIKRCYDR